MTPAAAEGATLLMVEALPPEMSSTVVLMPVALLLLETWQLMMLALEVVVVLHPQLLLQLWAALWVAPLGLRRFGP